MATPPDHSNPLDFLSTAWAWLSALVAGIFHVGVTSQKFKAVEAKVDRLEGVHEDLAVMKADIGWIKKKLEE